MATGGRRGFVDFGAIYAPAFSVRKYARGVGANGKPVIDVEARPSQSRALVKR